MVNWEIARNGKKGDMPEPSKALFTGTFCDVS